MKNPSYRTYIFLVVLLIAMFVGWKSCGNYNTSQHPNTVPVKAGSTDKPDNK